MEDIPNIKKELKNMQKMLKGKDDEKLIEGYKKAMIDYDITGNEQCKNAALLIKRELDDRGIEV